MSLDKNQPIKNTSMESFSSSTDPKRSAFSNDTHPSRIKDQLALSSFLNYKQIVNLSSCSKALLHDRPTYFKAARQVSMMLLPKFIADLKSINSSRSKAQWSLFTQEIYPSWTAYRWQGKSNTGKPMSKSGVISLFRKFQAQLKGLEIDNPLKAEILACPLQKLLSRPLRETYLHSVINYLQINSVFGHITPSPSTVQFTLRVSGNSKEVHKMFLDHCLQQISDKGINKLETLRLLTCNSAIHVDNINFFLKNLIKSNPKLTTLYLPNISSETLSQNTFLPTLTIPARIKNIDIENFTKIAISFSGEIGLLHLRSKARAPELTFCKGKESSDFRVKRFTLVSKNTLLWHQDTPLYWKSPSYTELKNIALSGLAPDLCRSLFSELAVNTRNRELKTVKMTSVSNLGCVVLPSRNANEVNIVLTKMKDLLYVCAHQARYEDSGTVIKIDGFMPIIQSPCSPELPISNIPRFFYKNIELAPCVFSPATE